MYGPRQTNQNQHFRPEGTYLTMMEWDALYRKFDGWYIMDPDGFDRSNPLFHLLLYSEQDFVDRRMKCTMGYTGYEKTPSYSE